MATRISVTPGFKTFYDDADPSLQYRVDETTAQKTISHDGGRTWTRDDTPPMGGALSGFDHAIEHLATTGGPGGFGIGQDAHDAGMTILKNLPTSIGLPALAGGFGDAGPFGFGADTPATSIPAAFGSTAVDTAAGATKVGAQGLSPLMQLLIPGMMSIGGKTMESLLAPQPQHFTSFVGGPNDPNKLLSESGTNLRDVFAKIAPQLLAPPDLSDAYVQDLPSPGSGEHATWGGGNGPQRRAPQMPTMPSPTTPAPTSAASPDMSSILSQLTQSMSAGAPPTATATVGPARIAMKKQGPTPMTMNPRTMGAAQLLLHLSQPSVMAGATA